MRTTVRIILLVLPVLLLVLSSAVVSADSFAVGPPSMEVTVPADGEGSFLVYINADFDGELLINTEGIPFDVEPEVIEIDSSWHYEEVELTLHGEPSVAAGTYEGKVTFLAYRGGNVAGGVKLDITATKTGVGSAASIPTTPTTPTTPGNWLRDNYLYVVLPLMAVIALISGILIGRRGKLRKAAVPARRRRHAVPRNTGRGSR
jgi:hypothetical protein